MNLYNIIYSNILFCKWTFSIFLHQELEVKNLFLYLVFNFNLQNLSLNNTTNSLLRPIAIKATSQINEDINEEKITSST